MEIKFQFRGRVFSISFGYKTEWHESMYFLWIDELFYENKEVIYASAIFYTN